jgi:hypothetical protein
VEGGRVGDERFIQSLFKRRSIHWRCELKHACIEGRLKGRIISKTLNCKSYMYTLANTCVNGDVNAIRILKISINPQMILPNIRINQWQVT